jgi:phosphodiesterase/alkaline phosphatase D-like protein
MVLFMRNTLVSLLLLAGLTPLMAADKVVGGPLVVNVTARTATVVWIVQSDEAVMKTADGSEVHSAPVLRSESVRFTGLKAGMSYEYQVPGRPDLKGSLKTPPAGEGQFEFVVYGDTRTRHDVHRKVIAALLEHCHPDFAVQTGDLVNDGGDPALWPIFFDIEHDLLRQVAYFPALGNHERHSHNYADFMQAAPYYSFNWGNAHFAILDTDLGNAAPSELARQTYWKEQTEWLADDLEKNQKAAFRFVAGHHPPMTAVSNRQGDNPHMIALTPLLEQYHVTAAFFGHDHNYQHYLKNGIHYVITGGGGAPLYDVDKPPQGITQKVAKAENFVRVRVDGRKAHVEAITPDGATIDDFSVEGAAMESSATAH